MVIESFKSQAFTLQHFLNYSALFIKVPLFKILTSFKNIGPTQKRFILGLYSTKNQETKTQSQHNLPISVKIKKRETEMQDLTITD